MANNEYLCTFSQAASESQPIMSVNVCTVQVSKTAYSSKVDMIKVAA